GLRELSGDRDGEVRFAEVQARPPGEIALGRRSVASEITARELAERFFDIEDTRLREPLVAQDERGLLVAVRADAQDAAHRERRQNVYAALPVRRDPRSRELRVR